MLLESSLSLSISLSYCLKHDNAVKNCLTNFSAFFPFSIPQNLSIFYVWLFFLPCDTFLFWHTNFNSLFSLFLLLSLWNCGSMWKHTSEIATTASPSNRPSNKYFSIQLHLLLFLILQIIPSIQTKQQQHIFATLTVWLLMKHLSLHFTNACTHSWCCCCCLYYIMLC